MRLLFLGDIHADLRYVHYHIDTYDIKDAHIVQVGDFGIGFNTFVKDKRMLEMFHQKLVKNNIFLWGIRGNHDYKPYFDNDPFELSNIKLVPDNTVLNLGGYNILCLGGGISVDRKVRMSKSQLGGDFSNNNCDQNWWSDEGFVLDVEKLSSLRDIDIVVSHTAPHYCPIDNTFSFGPLIERMVKVENDIELKSELMYERSQMTEAFHILKMNNYIKYHFYGHFHRSDTITIDGTIHRVLDTGEFWEEKNYE